MERNREEVRKNLVVYISTIEISRVINISNFLISFIFAVCRVIIIPL